MKEERRKLVFRRNSRNKTDHRAVRQCRQEWQHLSWGGAEGLSAVWTRELPKPLSESARRNPRHHRGPWREEGKTV